MNVERVVSQLQKQYPDKTIIKIPENNPTEIICEVQPTSENPEKSIAIAVIEKSTPHLHKISTEIYQVKEGAVDIYVYERKKRLRVNESITIAPNTVHWIEADSAVVKVTSTPGWTPENHILAKNQ